MLARRMIIERLRSLSISPPRQLWRGTDESDRGKRTMGCSAGAAAKSPADQGGASHL